MTASVWHDTECGSYAEDLPLWEELAAAHGSPVLELGAGTGRVALHLARRGCEVHAVEIDRELARVMAERVESEHVPVRVIAADVRELAPSRRYPLVIGAMQLVQLLGGAEGRTAALDFIATALDPGGIAALAIVEGSEALVGDATAKTLPDVREEDGVVYSSLPLGVVADNGHLHVRRLRQVVSPAGDLTETEHADVLDVLDATTLASEARAAGLTPAGVRAVSESPFHVGSSVVLLQRGG